MIGHPNIYMIHDLGAFGGRGSPYLVMERLIGETLAERLAQEGRVAFDEAADVLIQVLSALAVTHQKGIVHRDIKPANVFLSRRVGCAPLVKVLDFGISKMMAFSAGDGREETRLTDPGIVMGTLGYMSLEQARGSRDLDARVDLYACGVILYEALTGRRPFPANNIRELVQLMRTMYPLPAGEVVSGLPAVDAVIDRALARNRESRYNDGSRHATRSADAAGTSERGARGRGYVCAGAGVQLAGHSHRVRQRNTPIRPDVPWGGRSQGARGRPRRPS